MGVSITELLVAVALLTVLTSAIGQFVAYTRRAIESRELFRLIHWELDSAREQIGSWHPEEVTTQRVGDIAFSDAIQQRLQNSKWVVQIEPAKIQGVAAVQFYIVRLGMTANFHEQVITPDELVFWIPTADDSMSQDDKTSIPSQEATESEREDNQES